MATSSSSTSTGIPSTTASTRSFKFCFCNNSKVQTHTLITLFIYLFSSVTFASSYCPAPSSFGIAHNNNKRATSTPTPIRTRISTTTLKMMLARSTTIPLREVKKNDDSGSSGGGGGDGGGKRKNNGSGGGSSNTLIGRSRAGDGTSFAIPELKWLFDCGALVQGWSPKVVFITHTHSDHVHYLTHIKNDQHPPTIYLPEEAAPFVKAHYIAHQEMSDCMTQSESQQGGTYAIDYILRPTKAGEEITFRQSGTEYIIRAIAMDHRIPCLGYSIFKKNPKLKEEFVGLPGLEIGRLIKQGVEITTTVEEPLICFMGDTTATVFDDNPKLLKQHKFVVVECSFIDKDSLDRADTTKHMHWDHLRPHVESNPNTMFLLTHFSLKYSIKTLREFFCEQQKQYNNIHPLLVLEEEEMEEKNSKEKGGAPLRCQCRLCSL